MIGAFDYVAIKLPVGDHWILGPKNGLINLHLDTVLLSLAVSALLLIVGIAIRSSITSGPPSRLQNAVESIMAFIDGIVQDSLGSQPGQIASIALTLFFYIWVANLLGLLPVPTYIHSPTSDINATLALALLVFVLLHARFIGTSGLSAYKGHYWVRWWPWGIILNPISVLLGAVNELSRPLTLSFRLFGNILAGEILLIVWAYLLAPAAGAPVTIVWNAVFILYGIFVGTIQAFIFTVLTVAYMAIASEPVHDH